MRDKLIWIIALALVVLTFILSSCTIPINPTQSQKRDRAANKFGRFRQRPAERRFMEVTAFSTFSAAAYLAQQIHKNK